MGEDVGRDPGKGPEAFRTISEVAEDLGLPQHVLRFWETRFPQIKPIKRGGGRRYYRPNDVELLRGIKRLLYGEGYTIRGVQRILREQGGRRVASFAAPGGAEPPAPQAADAVPDAPAVDPGLSGPRWGPEVWAPPPRRGAAPPGTDPTPAEEPYQAPRPGPTSAEDEAVALPAAAPALPPEAAQRLAAALAELRECRRLLDERL
jgi:DNA-binding transcriptional MerR regulator